METAQARRFAILSPEVFDGFAMRGPGALLVEDGRVLGLGQPADLPQDCERVELAEGSVLAPGFVDWQVNGGGGALLNDNACADAVRIIAQAHASLGTTSIAPTLITDSADRLERLCDLDACAIPGVVGLHLEGPFINAEKKGAHPREHVRELAPDDLERLALLVQKGPCVVSLAPERVPPGAVRALVESGVIVSLGHSNATSACATAAADEGATGVTHLFNAMSQMTAREPGLVGTALTDTRLMAGVIADGEHVAPLNLSLALRMMGPDRLMLVSDAMPSVGAALTTFTLMQREVTLKDGRLTLSDGALAGAHLSMGEAVARMVRLAGAPLADALRMATRTPARFLGLEADIGLLRPGVWASAVALDSSLNIANVWLRGQPVTAATQAAPR